MESKQTVNIVDSIMGSGKTQAAINYINSADDSKKFIYITPYLSEVERIIKCCPTKHFKQPVKYNEGASKTLHLKALLNRGENIVTTHALFHYFDDEIVDICYCQGYILFMDEVTDVISSYEIDKTDLRTLLDKYVDVRKDGILSWKEEYSDYTGDKYANEKHLCSLESLALYGGDIMLWLFPIHVFKAFNEIYILTYMFKAQLQSYYYDFYNINYKYLYVSGDSLDTYYLSEEPVDSDIKYNYKDLIHIFNDEKLNKIGDQKEALSKTWFLRNKGNSVVKQLKNNTYNFFNNKPTMRSEDGTLIPSKSSNNIWTTFKDFKTKLQGKGYTKGFIPSNLRATNDYKDKCAVAYLINKYFNPCIKQFFTGNNIEVYEDDYALSEMLQFLWRSGIRDGREIWVYVPSKRMRTLLQNWIEKMHDLLEEN